jgi:hypothetical protein
MAKIMDPKLDALDKIIDSKLYALHQMHLYALYEMHRHQVLLNSKDYCGEYQLSEAYLFAVAKGIYPHWHNREWCQGNDDPYSDCYAIKEDFIQKIVESLETHKPTYLDLEGSHGGNTNRHHLRMILRYAYAYFSENGHNELYEEIFERLFNSSCAESAEEGKMICKPLEDEELRLQPMPNKSAITRNNVIPLLQSKQYDD